VGGTLGTSTTANGIFGGGGIGTGGCVPTIAPANGQIQYTGFQQAGIYPAGTSATLICLSGLFQLIFGHSFVYSFFVQAFPQMAKAVRFASPAFGRHPLAFAPAPLHLQEYPLGALARALAFNRVPLA
jgi:hypothetical protein